MQKLKAFIYNVYFHTEGHNERLKKGIKDDDSFGRFVVIASNVDDAIRVVHDERPHSVITNVHLVSDHSIGFDPPRPDTILVVE